MAWTFEEKFNNLNTATIVGQDGWSISNDTQGTKTVINTLSYEGSKCLKLTGDNGYSYRLYKTITAVTNGTVYISMRGDALTKYVFFKLGEGANERAYVGLNAGYIAGGANNLQSYVANTWYRIGIAFECGSGSWEGLAADTYKVNINNGAWSAAINFAAASTNIDRIIFEQYSSTENWYFDFISPTYLPINNARSILGKGRLLTF